MAVTPSIEEGGIRKDAVINSLRSEWRKLVEEDKFEPLVRDLIVEYYDKCYRIPRGDPLKVYKVPDGLILDQQKLRDSQMILDMISLGTEFMSKLSERK